MARGPASSSGQRSLRVLRASRQSTWTSTSSRPDPRSRRKTWIRREAPWALSTLIAERTGPAAIRSTLTAEKASCGPSNPVRPCPQVSLESWYTTARAPGAASTSQSRSLS